MAAAPLACPQAHIYGLHATTDSSGHQSCVGASCFRLTFWIAAGIAMCGVFAAAALALRSGGFYRGASRWHAPA